MAVDFPNSPAINDTFVSGDKTYLWNGTTWDLQSYSPGEGAFYAADTAPGSPLTGDVWYDTSVGKTYIRYDNYWVEVGNSGAVQSSHASQHLNGGPDPIDGDRLRVDYVPATYSRNALAAGATANTDLAAHLDGINSHFQRHSIGPVPPAGPVAGWLWYDTNFALLKVFNGTNWVTAYPAGSIIQTVVARTDTRTTFASNNSGNGTTITQLNLTITPRFSSSRIWCQWMINGELHQDNVILIHRDGAVATSPAGYNTSVGNIRSSGYAAGFYDQNEDSTPSNWYVSYIDTNVGSIATRTYAPAVRSSSGSNFTFALNRTLNGSTGDSQESMVSTGVAMEIAP